MNRTKLHPHRPESSFHFSPIKFFVFFAMVLMTSASALAQPTATISASGSLCDGQSFNLILSPTPPPTGAAPFDLTITGPNGTATYFDIPVGGIITNFVPPTERIWPADPAPIPPTNIDASVTLGVKFQSSVSGFVKGVRFFSPDDVSAVPGDYTGQLWTAGGVLLASGTFTGVTTDSWQELTFASPILIDANTTYVASYHTKSIEYVSTAGGLIAGVTNGSLTALDDVTAGGNGVYTYGATPTFPVTSVGANYWADVIFSPNNYTFDLTSITDDNGVNNTGALQTLNITSVDCSTLPVTIVVNPLVTTTSVGQSFTVTVAADFNGAPLGVDDIEIHLAFDNTKLSVTNIVEGPVVSAFTAKPIPLEPSPYTATNTAGQIDYRATTTAGIPTTDFDIISITFLVIGGDGTTTPLTIRQDLPLDASGAAGSGSSVLAGVIDGTVTINAAGCVIPSVTMSAPAGVTTCNSQPFNLVLSAAPAGQEPFDLTITGPGGTATYDDIPVGGVITNFTPTVEKIWPNTPAPVPFTGIDASVTLGVKFQSSVSGFVTGVRFFSPDEVSLVPGFYTGQLWTESGTLLASGTFTGLATNIWQELTFATPILIDANTTYVASYHTDGIKYVGTFGGLVTGVTNGSLTALDNATAGGNGVYTYGAAAAFPTTSNGSNYWVDVIFAPNVYSFNLIGVKDALECSNAGALQALSVTSVDCATLPVTLLNLSAVPKEKTIHLNWVTSSENNNKGFEIQRSIDAANWSVISFVNGAGTSNSIINYSYVDGSLSSGRYYYRLKQIDIDLRFVYSAVVSAVIGGNESFSLAQNFPNPFRSETIVRFTLPQKSKVNLSIFDMYGRLVKVLVNESRDKGTHAINVYPGTLSAGLYYYKIQAGDFTDVKKMTIQ